MSGESRSLKVTSKMALTASILAGIISLCPNQLPAQHLPEKKKEDPKSPPALKDETLSKIKEKLDKIDPGDDELRRLLKDRWQATIKYYELEKSRLPLALDPIAFRAQLYADYKSCVQAALELLDQPSDQVSLIQEFLDTAKNLETEMPKDLVRPQRLEIEIFLVKTKRKLRPPPAEEEWTKAMTQLAQTAREEFNRIKAQEDRTPDRDDWLEQLRECLLRRLEAETELHQSTAEQIPAIKETLESARRAEKFYRDRAQRGLALPLDVERMRGQRLELEILLVKTNQKVNDQSPEASDNKLRKLLKERVEAADKQYALIKAKGDIAPDTLVWLEELFVCRYNALTFSIEAAGDLEERLRVIQEALKLAKDWENEAQKRTNAGFGSPQEAQRARLWRLEVEILLAKTKLAAKPEK